jgi:hypothetical protein
MTPNPPAAARQPCRVFRHRETKIQMVLWDVSAMEDWDSVFGPDTFLACVAWMRRNRPQIEL